MRVLILFCAAAAYAQPNRPAELRLTVSDPTGAGMQADVTFGGIHHQTDPLGHLTLSRLAPGNYPLEVARKGFLRQIRTLSVPAGGLTLNITLPLDNAPATRLEVVATMPLPGVDLPINQVATPVKTATQVDIAESGALDLSDFLNRRMNGVYLNDVQGNPFQTDVNFRGYTASPLLGTPQGISIYLDGVRQNQPFGDVVSWDLIPQNAISSVTLIPGSDPLFGLNTLGGALSLQTKDGSSSPGLSANLLYGSSGRKDLQAEYGGSRPNGLNWFFAANAFHESGWRFNSPSDVRQGFARVGRQFGNTTLALTAGYSYNTLTGNGLQDSRLLSQNWSGAYTVPDTIGNRSPSVNLIVRHVLNAKLSFSGNLYFRNIRSEGVNGNLNTESLGESVYQPSVADRAALTAAGYTGFPTSGANATNTPFPKWRCIAQGLLHAEPIEKCDAVLIYSKVVQNNYGVSGQVTWFSSRQNQLTAGIAFDRGNVAFTQNTQFGYLAPNRAVIGISSWEDGTTNQNGDPVDSRVNLKGTVPNASIYASDFLSLGKWHFNFAGRFNRNTIDNQDRLNPGGGPGSLDAHDVFQRFNPSVGVTYTPNGLLNAYASYTQGSRAPTSIELGCADPLNPCNLPNALASDPPLKQVTTATWEAGVRGKVEGILTWNAGAFRAENSNDILFVASQQTGAGYFQNFAKTRRQGMQASADAHHGPLSITLDYTLLDATYRSNETLNGNSNSTNVNGFITIHPGNEIPLTPHHTAKVYATWQATSKLVLHSGLIASSSSYARGDENNRDPAGRLPGYGIINLDGGYRINRRIQIIARVDNLLDHRYYTAAQLATSGLTAQGAYSNQALPAPFFSPGAPRRAWVEVRLLF